MSYLTRSAVEQLSPLTFMAYVEAILSNHRDTVIAELGISRFERPFFNSIGLYLEKSLVLSKLYIASNGAVPRPLFHPDDVTQIVCKLKGTTGRFRNWPELRFLDLGYNRGGIGDNLCYEYDGVQGVGISQSRGVVMHTPRPTASHTHGQPHVLDADILRAAERGTLGTYMIYSIPTTHQRSREQRGRGKL